MKNSPMGNGIMNQSFISNGQQRQENNSILAVGKASSSKWLPAVGTDKKKVLQSMN
jgi:hypothetical protein